MALCMLQLHIREFLLLIFTTGEEIWQYDAKLPDAILPCCDVINRVLQFMITLIILEHLMLN